MKSNFFMMLVVITALAVFACGGGGDDGGGARQGDDDDVDDDFADDDDTTGDDDSTGDDDDDDDDHVVDAGFVGVSAGTFLMGSPDGDGDDPAEPGRFADEFEHEVTLSNDFELSAKETTQGDFETLMGWNPSTFPACGATCPVEDITWYDAAAYANEASTAAGHAPCYTFSDVKCTVGGGNVGAEYMECMSDTVGGIDSATVGLNGVASVYDCEGFRLPTDAEWEYAARAGSTTAFYNGEITETAKTPLDANLGAIGWYGGNAGVDYEDGFACTEWFPGATFCGPQPGGGKTANAWNLFDMSGNVGEWTWDWTATAPDPSAPVTDPEGAASGSFKVERGGNWNHEARACRSANRTVRNPSDRNGFVGFRLARTLTD
jgi:formylglycine-generating enzyme required for sulfatase activity